MQIWDWVWIAWLAFFGVAEGIALKTGHGTFSEKVWTWFRVGRFGEVRPAPTGTTRALRFALLAIMSWLMVHFLSGGFI